MCGSLLSTRHTWTQECSLGFKAMLLPLWAAISSHKIKSAETYTKITGGQHTKGMSHLDSILPRERETSLWLGMGRIMEDFLGERKSNGMGQALIGREDIGKKLLLLKIRYLSWGPRGAIHFL